MIRSLLICSTLVVASGAGAVALSALHDATGDQSVRTLAPVPVASVEPRFIIPSYAPTPQAPEVVQVALRDAPVLPAAVTTDVAPEPMPEPVIIAAPAPQVAPAVKPAARASVAPKPRAAKKPVKSARVAPVKSKRTAKARAVRPVIVAQAPSFSARQSGGLTPDYVIGVYR